MTLRNLLRFLAGRSLRLLTVLAVITAAGFALLAAVPGDPVTVRIGEHASTAEIARVRASLGLDRPWYVQLARYDAALLHGDLGVSSIDGELVAAKLRRGFPATVELGVAALAVALAVGIPAGVLAAVRYGTVADALVRALVLLGVSVPIFWLGWLLVYTLAVLPARAGLDLFPVSGRLSLAYDVPTRTHLLVVDALLAGSPAAALDALRHLALPALTLATIPASIIAKITRSGMRETLGREYVRAARARGIGERAIVWRHALRNALGPILTIIGLQAGLVLGGAVLTESVFAWPGVGRLAFDAIGDRDVPVVGGCLVLFSATFVLVNAVVDVLYAVADPRLRYQ